MIRLLRIEARRSALVPLLPVLVLLLCLSPIGRHLDPVALWPDRSTDMQSTIQGLCPFVAGAAAWMATREHRRAMADLLASTPRNPWLRSMATWGVTIGWAVVFYLAAVAVVFVVTAGQATWGGPVWWPVLVGLVAVITAGTVGFAVGRCFPSRFTAPLAAIGLFAVMAAGMSASLVGYRFGLLSPINPSIGLASSVFYAIRPDLSIVQIIFYLGVVGIALGAITFPSRTSLPSIRRAGVALLAAGLALAATGVGLISTSHRDSQGVVVPAIHNAANDLAVPYTPVCGPTALPVCLHPAYAGELTVLTTVIDDIAAPLAGAPGIPVRAEQLPGGENGGDGLRVEGNPPVLTVPHFIIHGTTIQPPAFAQNLRTIIALALVTPPGTPPDHTTSGQRALALYLVTQAHAVASSRYIPEDAVVASAAQRLAALSSTARTAWLATHLDAVRHGDLTPTDIP